MLFVAVFNWGVAGVAWATFIAQGAACILAMIAFRKRIAEIETKERAQLFSAGVLKKVACVAVPFFTVYFFFGETDCRRSIARCGGDKYFMISTFLERCDSVVSFVF